jgi:hypothetical protein
MKPRTRKPWEETALILAETIAQCRSQDPYVQVGACAVLQDNSVCLGYNGPPPGVEIDWSEREHRGPRITVFGKLAGQQFLNLAPEVGPVILIPTPLLFCRL